MKENCQRSIAEFKSCYSLFEVSYLEAVEKLISRKLDYPLDLLIEENNRRGRAYLTEIANFFKSGRKEYFYLRLNHFDEFDFIEAFDKFTSSWGLNELSSFAIEISDIKLECAMSSKVFQNDVLPLFGKVGRIKPDLINLLGGKIKSNSRNQTRIVFDGAFEGRGCSCEVFIDKSSRSVPKDLAFSFVFFFGPDCRAQIAPSMIDYGCNFQTIRPPKGTISESQMELLEHFDLYTQISAIRNLFYFAEKCTCREPAAYQ